MKSKRLWLLFVFLTLIFTVAFFYRIYGLSIDNPPFWVDEFSSANQGKLFLQYGLSLLTKPDIYVEFYNITTHSLVAFSYKLFGINELAARFPSVLIGSLVPIVVFFLSRYLFNLPTAISASLLTTFSYFEIVWSRQARGYIILQLLVLLSIFLYFKFLAQKKITRMNLLFFVFLLLGIITHPLFYILLLAFAVHSILTNRSRFSNIIHVYWKYLLITLAVIFFFKINELRSFFAFLQMKLFLTNNFWYYHSFLWREYGMVTFLALFGAFISIFKQKNKASSFLPFYIFLHLFFLSFIFKPHVSRYLTPIFPFFLIYFSYAISEFKTKNLIITTLITIFVVFNGYKFINKPKKYYSLNHDFREISNIDYNQIYGVVKSQMQGQKNKIAIVDTWWDRSHWYLDSNSINFYLFRWRNDIGYINGLPTKTFYTTNKYGERILAGSDVKLVLDVGDLNKVMQKNRAGFLFIDDSSLSQDVREFAEKNLKKELYLDHYPLDDNPYSIWPATLYSWGLK